MNLTINHTESYTKILGTAAYLGIGEPLDKIAAHLEMAAKAGLNAVFTSLHLPESDPEELKRDLPRFTEIAHSYGLMVDSDISPRTMMFFGIDNKDPATLKSLGIDIARLDAGYTPEETARLTRNDAGLVIEINASRPGSTLRSIFMKLEEAGMNKDNIRACHNYYPKAYTGLTRTQVKEANDAVHEAGLKAAGFIPSLSHRRSACNDGLPTLERHRFMDPHASIQEMYLLGIDDIFFGDDFAGDEEIRILAASGRQKAIELRIELLDGSEEAKWLLNRDFRHFQTGLEYFIRLSERYPVPLKPAVAQPRKIGDITIDNAGYGRYKGEVNIIRKDMPFEPRVNTVARVIEEDRPVLELITGPQPVRLVLK